MSINCEIELKNQFENLKSMVQEPFGFTDEQMTILGTLCMLLHKEYEPKCRKVVELINDTSKTDELIKEIGGVENFLKLHNMICK